MPFAVGKNKFSYFKLPLYLFSLYMRKKVLSDCDIIYANAQMAGLIGFFISAFTKKKLVIHLRQLLEPEFLCGRILYLRPECFILFGVNFSKKIVNYLVSQNNTAAICISEHIRKSLNQSGKANVIYNAIDGDWFNSTSEEEKMISQKSMESAEPKHILHS